MAQMRAADAPRRRILVVEDEPDVREVVRRLLDEAGYHVHEAADGRQALDLVRAAPSVLDLVVTDIRMPRLNGLALMQTLAVETPDLPFILISGYAPGDLQRFGLVPACGVLRKPLVEPEFLAEVRRCLRQRN